MSTQKNRAEYDIVIVGGGLAGASLAVALGDSRYRVAVVEEVEFDSNAQPAYDERTIALTYSARYIFSQLEVWNEIVEKEACALNSIHISNRGHFGMTHLDRRDIGTPALGYVVPIRTLGKALNHRIGAADNIDFLCPYAAESVETGDDGARVKIRKPGARRGRFLNARLLVVADGGRSSLLDDLGLVRKCKRYNQSALLSIVRTSLPHRHRAYERFIDDGPLALLPMTGQRFAVVWTLAPDELEATRSLSDHDYIEALQAAFGTHAGLFSEPSPRKAYPLSMCTLDPPFTRRILALGNAAHSVHPVAGQGFNLGLRDVAGLSECLLSASEETDIGASEFLHAYSESRKLDTRNVTRFTDGLLGVFTHRSPFIQLGRNLGLALVENMPLIKRALLKRSMGLQHYQPRMARGLKRR